MSNQRQSICDHVNELPQTETHAIPLPIGSQLVDRVASLEAEKNLLAQKLASPSPSSQSPNPSSSDAAPSATTTTDNPSSATAGPSPAELKRDLAEALRSKGQLEAKLKTSTAELQKLRTKTKTDDKGLHDLTAERNTLATKLKDRNEELVGKTKLLKVSLTSQILLNARGRHGWDTNIDGGGCNY